MYFYRTHQGTECDLVLVRGTKPEVCIEIKYTAIPKPSKGFRIAIDDLKTTDNYIITPNSDMYTVSGNIRVCSLLDFLNNYMNQFHG